MTGVPYAGTSDEGKRDDHKCEAVHVVAGGNSHSLDTSVDYRVVEGQGPADTVCTLNLP